MRFRHLLFQKPAWARAREAVTNTTRYRHSIRLHGGGARGRRISGALLRDLLDLLVEGCRGAVRLRIEGRSSARGTAPSWLSEASVFEVLPLEEGSTILPLEGSPLAEVAPERFAQYNFLEVDVTRTALSLFEESLKHALDGDEEAELFDPALLQKFSGLSKLFGKGVERVEIESEEPKGVQFLKVEPARLEQVQRLIRKTPPAQRARLAGKLDTIRHSDRMFTLVLESGETIKGFAEGLAAGQLASYFGQTVVVQGTVTFRPSGRVLRVEPDEISLARGDVSVWSRMPRVLLGGIEGRALRVEQGARSGLLAICGNWPGEESDEELMAALAEVS